MAADADRVLAEEHNVPADVVASLRKRSLSHPEDWSTVDRVVTYTERGRANLAALLASRVPKKKGAAPNDEELKPENEVELTIIRVCPNPLFVLARLPATHSEVIVEVRDNRRLTPGDILLCVQRGDEWVGTQGGLSPLR